jgi:hypothetical protein
VKVVEALGQFFSVQLAAWVATMGLLAHYWRRRNEPLRDAANEKVSDWARLRDEIVRLDARCDHLQHEVDECRKREADWMARAIAAEAYQLGEGEALQAAQRILSAERQKPNEGNGA